MIGWLKNGVVVPRWLIIAALWPDWRLCLRPWPWPMAGTLRKSTHASRTVMVRSVSSPPARTARPAKPPWIGESKATLGRPDRQVPPEPKARQVYKVPKVCKAKLVRKARKERPALKEPPDSKATKDLKALPARRDPKVSLAKFWEVQVGWP